MSSSCTETVFVIPAPHRVRDKLQQESSFFALAPCSFDFAQDRFRKGDIVGFYFPQQILSILYVLYSCRGLGSQVV